MRQWIVVWCLLLVVACEVNDEGQEATDIDDTAETGTEMFPSSEWSWFDCDDDACAVLTLDGLDTLMLGFSDDGVAYRPTIIAEI